MNKMCFTEIIIKVPSIDLEQAASIANMVVPYGIYIEDYSNLETDVYDVAHVDLIDDELLKKDKKNSMIHVYIYEDESPYEAISFLSERLKFCGIKNDIVMSRCRQEDFINNWKKYFKAIDVGERLLVNPVWEECKDANGRIVLNLEPGLAFGTGTHETTKLCLELIEKFLRPHDEVLDIGCGSGILSIGSILLGAQSAVGVDIDDMAVKTAIENARINKVDSKFSAVAGNLTEKIFGKYDIIVANIVADAILQLTKDVSKFMRKSTVYIVSGIISQRREEVRNCLKDKFMILEEKCQNDWVAIAAKGK